MGTSSFVTRSITSASLLLALAHGIAGCASDIDSRAGDSPDPADQIDEGGSAGPEEPTAEATSALDEVAQWCTDYCYDTGWRTAKHLRRLADVDGDGLIDVVGFNDAGVYVSRSLGSSFAAPEVWLSDFGYNGGWRVDRHPRYLADVDGDGKQDIVGFYDDGAYVSLSLGTSFAPRARWLADYGYSADWSNDRHLRRVADVNGDGAADIVGVAPDGVYVSLSTREGFTAPELKLARFGYNDGFRANKHLLEMGDVDGDGLLDLVAFLDDAVYVSRWDGSAFTEPMRWVWNYGYTMGNWRIDRHPRYLADVNGDGMMDVVGFHNLGTYVSVSRGTSFAPPFLWANAYGYDVGRWRTDRHLRYLTDISGDGKADVVGFDDDGVVASLALDNAFAEPVRRVANFALRAGDWEIRRDVRVLGDVDGNGTSDIVGFNKTGVYVYPF